MRITHAILLCGLISTMNVTAGAQSSSLYLRENVTPVASVKTGSGQSNSGLTANGQGMGSELKIKQGEEIGLEAWALYRKPLLRMELVVNGEVVHTASAAEGAGEIKTVFRWKPQKSGWLFSVLCFPLHHSLARLEQFFYDRCAQFSRGAR